MNSKYEDKVFLVDRSGFDQLALDLFHFQYDQNPVYREYVNALQIVGQAVQRVEDIPFLPIQLFKTRDVRSTTFEPEAVFMSSGTTQTINSRHAVKSLALYRQSFLLAFEQFYGPVNEWCIIGLLPSYLERSNSSLVVMADELIRRSAHPNSGFYLYEHEKLARVLQAARSQ